LLVLLSPSLNRMTWIKNSQESYVRDSPYARDKAAARNSARDLLLRIRQATHRRPSPISAKLLSAMIAGVSRAIAPRRLRNPKWPIQPTMIRLGTVPAQKATMPAAPAMGSVVAEAIAIAAYSRPQGRKPSTTPST